MGRTITNDGVFMYDHRSPGYDAKNREYTDTEFTSEISAPKMINNTIGKTTTFENCTFTKNLTIVSDENELCVLTFINCVFKQEILGEDAVIDGKVRFRNCHFKGNVNFRNTTFNNLVDFWNSTFYLSTTFYKTDFNDIVVFSAVTFKENVLFTYTLIDKLMILRGAKPEKGFDLSLAIISGKLSVFDFKLKFFKPFNCHKAAMSVIKKDASKGYLKHFEEVYENAVSSDSEIPIHNKRETYRILKKHHESQSNIVESIPFSVLEKRTLFKESWLNLTSFKNNKNKFTAFSNLWVLFWNAISNRFSSSYILGVFFTLSIGVLFFNLSLLFTTKATFAFDIFSISSGVKDFLNFSNPVHKFDYLSKSLNYNRTTMFYVFDFTGRLFLGYGIYQTIQAFRKYK